MAKNEGSELVEQLKKIREIHKLSVDRLAKELGVHYQTIQGWFSGKYKPSRLAQRAIKNFLARHF